MQGVETTYRRVWSWWGGRIARVQCNSARSIDWPEPLLQRSHRRWEVHVPLGSVVDIEAIRAVKGQVQHYINQHPNLKHIDYGLESIAVIFDIDGKYNADVYSQKIRQALHKLWSDCPALMGIDVCVSVRFSDYQDTPWSCAAWDRGQKKGYRKLAKPYVHVHEQTGHKTEHDQYQKVTVQRHWINPWLKDLLWHTAIVDVSYLSQFMPKLSFAMPKVPSWQDLPKLLLKHGPVFLSIGLLWWWGWLSLHIAVTLCGVWSSLISQINWWGLIQGIKRMPVLLFMPFVLPFMAWRGYQFYARWHTLWVPFPLFAGLVAVFGLTSTFIIARYTGHSFGQVLTVGATWVSAIFLTFYLPNIPWLLFAWYGVYQCANALYAMRGFATLLQNSAVSLAIGIGFFALMGALGWPIIASVNVGFAIYCYTLISLAVSVGYYLGAGFLGAFLDDLHMRLFASHRQDMSAQTTLNADHLTQVHFWHLPYLVASALGIRTSHDAYVERYLSPDVLASEHVSSEQDLVDEPPKNALVRDAQGKIEGLAP